MEKKDLIVIILFLILIELLVEISQKATFFLIRFYIGFYLEKASKKHISNRMDLDNEVERFF